MAEPSWKSDLCWLCCICLCTLAKFQCQGPEKAAQDLRLWSGGCVIFFIEKFLCQKSSVSSNRDSACQEPTTLEASKSHKSPVQAKLVVIIHCDLQLVKDHENWLCNIVVKTISCADWQRLRLRKWRLVACYNLWIQWASKGKDLIIKPSLGLMFLQMRSLQILSCSRWTLLRWPSIIDNRFTGAFSLRDAFSLGTKCMRLVIQDYDGPKWLQQKQ